MDERFSDAPESSVRNSTHAVWSEYQESPTVDNTIDQHYKRTGTRKSGRRATVSSSSSKKMSRQTPRVSSDGRKFSSEVFALTYGALVAQLLKDYENDDEVNKQLDKMGYSMGVRMIEDFLARTNVGRCHDFRDTADIIAKNGFKTFLGITPNVTNWSSDGKEFSLIIDNNPLTEFVELPENHTSLSFSNVLCGALRGALEMVQMEVEVWFVQDSLKGDDTTEIRLKFIKKLEDALPDGED